MNAPKLSIVIATYNASSTLQRCLDSIINQNFKDYEIILIDGLSTDQTQEIIATNEANIAYWHSKKDSGIYDAWNQGIEKCKGEYVCFIGADDLFSDENSLLRLQSALESDNNEIISSKGRFLISGGGHHVIGNPWNHKNLEKRITICHPGLMHKRSLFDKYGKFNTSYRIAGDYEFLLRLRPETISTHVDSITVDISDGGISRSRYFEMLKEKRQIQSSCPRIGKSMAAWNYYEKIVKIPIAKILGIPY